MPATPSLIPNRADTSVITTALAKAPGLLALLGVDDAGDLADMVVGYGSFAVAFSTPSGHILKVTTDASDAQAMRAVMEAQGGGGRLPGLPRVIGVYQLAGEVRDVRVRFDGGRLRVSDGENVPLFAIVVEEVVPLEKAETKLNEMSRTRRAALKKATQARMSGDPKWWEASGLDPATMFDATEAEERLAEEVSQLKAAVTLLRHRVTAALPVQDPQGFLQNLRRAQETHQLPPLGRAYLNDLAHGTLTLAADGYDALGDLHHGNVGFTYDGAAVILDMGVSLTEKSVVRDIQMAVNPPGRELTPNAPRLEDMVAAVADAPKLLKSLGVDHPEVLVDMEVGRGSFAAAFLTPSGRILKLTIDEDDAQAMQQVMSAQGAQRLPGFPRVYSVQRLPAPARERVIHQATGGRWEPYDLALPLYAIVVERVVPAGDMTDRKERQEDELRRIAEAQKAARATGGHGRWWELIEPADSAEWTPMPREARQLRMAYQILRAVRGDLGSDTAGFRRRAHELASTEGLDPLGRQYLDELVEGAILMAASGFDVLGDLHDDNVGLTVDGHAVILDLGNSMTQDTPEAEIPMAANPAADGPQGPVIDNVNGIGSTPNNANVDYLGLRVRMRPSVFLRLARHLPEHLRRAGTMDFVGQAMAEGRGIGAPSFYIDIPENWGDGAHEQAARVRGHEGRHRSVLAMQLFGDQAIEVHLFFNGGYRRKHLRPEWIEDIRSRLVSEDGKLVESGGGLFELDGGGDLARNGASPVDRVFDETFDVVERRFPDLGTIELYEDDAAGEDNGAGSERQFAYCQDGDPICIAFAPKAEQLPLNRLRGLMRHEFGHALEFRYGVAELERRLQRKLPDYSERRADVVAEAVFGEPILYDQRNIQCVRVAGAKKRRPKHLPDKREVLRPNGGGRR
jgi:hypothetical protein